MFNRRERQALLCLTTALAIGSVAALTDYWTPHALEEFRIVRSAVVVEEPAAELAPPWVDINRATVVDLQRLPSIGPKTAARIVDYRQQQGAFAAPEDLLQVRGIGVATLDKMKPFLRVV
jgi:competence ComEA-like helix-hairpin-helix protein